MAIEDEFDKLIIDSNGELDEKTVISLVKKYKKKLIQFWNGL
jgi:hypothetical protein